MPIDSASPASRNAAIPSQTDLALVTRPVRVVEQQHVEAVLPEALEAPLGGHPEVGAELIRPAKSGIGEAGEALRTVALPLVEVVADRADEAVAVPRDPGERPAEKRVRLPLPVGVGGQHGLDPIPRSKQGLQALLLDRLAEAQVAATAPGSDGGCAGARHGPHGSGGPDSPAFPTG